MTKKEVQQFIKIHHIDDALLEDFIDRKLYVIAIEQIPRIIKSYELKITALENLEDIINKIDD